jgi:hypothetical protein
MPFHRAIPCPDPDLYHDRTDCVESDPHYDVDLRPSQIVNLIAFANSLTRCAEQEWSIEDVELEAMARLWAHPSDLTLLGRAGIIMTGEDIDSDGDYFPAGPDVNPQLQAVRGQGPVLRSSVRVKMVRVMTGDDVDATVSTSRPGRASACSCRQGGVRARVKVRSEDGC